MTAKKTLFPPTDVIPIILRMVIISPPPPSKRSKTAATRDFHLSRMPANIAYKIASIIKLGAIKYPNPACKAATRKNPNETSFIAFNASFLSSILENNPNFFFFSSIRFTFFCLHVVMITAHPPASRWASGQPGENRLTTASAAGGSSGPRPRPGPSSTPDPACQTRGRLARPMHARVSPAGGVRGGLGEGDALRPGN